jgi:hypothetical protein
MIIIGLIAKWIAATFSQILLEYNKVERNLIFGLSSSRAAATLAAALIGYKIGIFGEDVLNGTVIMILVTCLVSSFIVEKNAKILATQKEDNSNETDKVVERILVPIANPKTVESLINLAVLIKNPESQHPIYALAVVRDNNEAKDRILDTLVDMKQSSDVSYFPLKDWKDILNIRNSLSRDDLLIVVLSRKGSISYDESMETTPRFLSQNLKDSNFILLYP